MSCRPAYEVSRTAAGRTRSVVFTTRKAAKDFKAANIGSVLKVVKLCDGKITRRGRRAF